MIEYHQVDVVARRQGGRSAKRPTPVVTEMTKAVQQQHGFSLKFASDELNDDHFVVLAAVKQAGLALQFGSDDLKADRIVVLAAVNKEGSSRSILAHDFR